VAITLQPRPSDKGIVEEMNQHEEHRKIVLLRDFSFLLPDVEVKLDEDGFVLPCTVDEDIHKR
jgi:hypothetical protein